MKSESLPPRLHSHSATPTGRAQGPGRIVGRGRELDEVGALLGTVSEGGLRVALIEGEAGIGKSRLIAAAGSVAARQGFTGLAGRADELETARPFGPLSDALAAVASDDDRSALADAVRQRKEGWEERGAEVIVDSLERLAFRGPVLLALDDLQWADDTTLTTIRRATRRLSHLPLAILGALRPLPRTRALSRLVDVLGREGAMWLRLEPLDPAAVDELIAATVGAPPADRLRAGVAGAGGNPLFVTELLEALDQEGAIRVAGGRAEVAAMSLPPTLRLTILRRLSALPEATLDTLRVASILGSTFDVAELSTLLARSVVDVANALRPAQLAGVIAEHGQRMAFRHDLIREAVEADQPAAVREALHGEAARMLEAAGAPPERVAAHLIAAAKPGDDGAFASLIRAAEALGEANDQVELLLYERCAELLPPGDRRRDAVVTALLPVLTTRGRGAESAKLAREILSRPHDPALDYRLHVAIQLILHREGRHLARWRATDKLLTEPWLTDEQRFRQQGIRTIAQLFSGDFRAAEPFIDQALRVTRSSGDEQYLTLLLCLAALAASGRGHVGKAIVFADEAAALFARLPRGEPADAYRGLVLIDADHLDEAALSFQRARVRMEGYGDVNSVPLCYWGVAFVAYATGHWNAALAEAETGRSVLMDTGRTGIAIFYAYAIRGLIAIHRGLLAEAAREVSSGLAELEDLGPQIGMDMLWLAESLLAEARGDSARALHILRTTWDRTASMRYFIAWRSTAPELVRLAVAGGDTETAMHVVEEAEEGAGRAAGMTSAEATALRCSALVSGDLDKMTAAAEAYGRSGRVRERALALEDAAALLARAGRTADARRVFDEALGIYDELGAVRDASRATAAMRSAGLRRGSRAPRKRPVSGWEALTPTERDVALLTVEGLTNQQIGDRLFVSKHTIRTHLSHAFTKLEFTSRAELAAVAARRQAESSSGSVARGQ